MSPHYSGPFIVILELSIKGVENCHAARDLHLVELSIAVGTKVTRSATNSMGIWPVDLKQSKTMGHVTIGYCTPIVRHCAPLAKPYWINFSQIECDRLRIEGDRLLRSTVEHVLVMQHPI